MKFLFDLLQKIIPPLGMFAGGVIPITLTATALTSSIPANNSSESLIVKSVEKPNLIEKTINPQSPPDPVKPEADEEENQDKETRDSEGTGDSGDQKSSIETDDKKQMEKQIQSQKVVQKNLQVRNQMILKELQQREKIIRKNLKK